MCVCVCKYAYVCRCVRACVRVCGVVNPRCGLDRGTSRSTRRVNPGQPDLIYLFIYLFIYIHINI